MRRRNELIGIEAVTVTIVGADIFLPVIRTRRSSSLEIDSPFPWHGEGAWIVDGERNLDALSAVVEVVALHDVQLLGMGRAVGVERSLIVQADGVDDESIGIFVMAHRFAGPGISGVLAMRHVEVNASHLSVAFGEDPNLFWSLEKHDGLSGEEKDTRVASRATQAVIDAVRPIMGAEYTYERLKRLLSLRASVIHGGAPDVCESDSYHRYYVDYGEDPIQDLELIVARCLQSVIFRGHLKERPHTYADLIQAKTGGIIK